MNTIKNILDIFKKISLSDLDQVKLMNRTDQKYCLHISKLPVILEALKENYSILAIRDEIIFEYDNTYFDTSDNHMFISHQNGNGKRYKVRVRKYVQSNLNYLEIKFKNNKGRTIKERMEREDFNLDFSNHELGFIQKNSPYSAELLQPKIRNTFNRFTLVDNDFTERVTVDITPGFLNDDKKLILKNLIIIEVKQSKMMKPALISQVLKEHKIERQGFSKYCIGRSLLEESIKKNNFKPLLLKIRKEYSN
jgi:hypothetical protein